MGQTRRDRLAIGCGHRQHDIDRALQITEMATRDEYRFHAGARAQDRTDRFALVGQRRPVAAVGTGLVEFAEEPRLGTADCGNAEPKTQMRGQAHPPWVGYPLAVADQHVRFHAELFKRVDDGRSFPESEQAGNIGELRSASTPERSRTSKVSACRTTTAA